MFSLLHLIMQCKADVFSCAHSTCCVTCVSEVALRVYVTIVYMIAACLCDQCLYEVAYLCDQCLYASYVLMCPVFIR